MFHFVILQQEPVSWTIRDLNWKNVLFFGYLHVGSIYALYLIFSGQAKLLTSLFGKKNIYFIHFSDHTPNYSFLNAQTCNLNNDQRWRKAKIEMNFVLSFVGLSKHIFKYWPGLVRFYESAINNYFQLATHWNIFIHYQLKHCRKLSHRFECAIENHFFGTCIAHECINVNSCDLSFVEYKACVTLDLFALHASREWK